MKSLPGVLLAIICMGIISCQKELTADPVIPPVPPTTNDSLLLKMYEIEIDGTVADTIDNWTYTYDAAKRVTRLYDSTGIYNGIQTFIDYQYFYNGSDTLPFKSVYLIREDPAMPDGTATTYFYYNTLGQRIKDSSIQSSTPAFPRYTVNHYQYTSGKIYGRTTDSIYNSSLSVYEVYHGTDTATLVNGNLVENSHRNDVQYVRTATITYDNKPSPFYKLSNAKTWAVFPFGETFFYEMPQINNRLKIREEQFSAGSQTLLYDEDLTGKYTYNSRGFPIHIIYPDHFFPGIMHKIIFVYKSL